MVDIIICYTKCWSCISGFHFEPPGWHTWADDEDIEHAKNTTGTDVTKQRCGCECANA